MGTESKRARRRKKRVVNVRDRDRIVITEPSVIRVRSVRGEGRRVDLEVTTERGKLKVIQRGIDDAPPDVIK